MDKQMVTLAMIVVAATAATLAVGIVVQQAFTRTEVEKIATAKQGAVSRVVIFEGRITNSQPDKNVFLLTDDTGSVELYTCPTWYRKIRVENGELVTVSGHILGQRPDAPGARYVVAVHSIRRSNGEQIVLRTTTGKPPWANGITIRSQR